MNIYQRMHAVMNDVSYVQKEDKKVNNQYTFVSHDAVTAKLRPAFLKHGILVLPTVLTMEQDGNRTEVRVRVDFVNVETPDERISIESIGFGIDPQDKGPGKAVSYAFKYALLKAFCLETGDDPERDSLEHQPKPGVGIHKPTDGAKDSLSVDMLTALDDAAKQITSAWALSSEEAFAEYDNVCTDLDVDEKTYLWSKLDSKVRSAIKKVGAAKQLNPLNA